MRDAVRVRSGTTLDDGHEASFFVVPERPALDLLNTQPITLVIRNGRIVRRP